MTEVEAPSPEPPGEPPEGLWAHDLAAIDATLRRLRELNAFDEEEHYLCSKALLYGLCLKTINPDKIAAQAQINRTKLRWWFKNLKLSKVIVVDGKGRGTGVWRVGWFEEDDGLLHFILDVMCAVGEIVREEEP